MDDVARNLYLTLLKKSLTNTLHAKEPDVEGDSEIRFVQNFTSHYVDGSAVTMLPLARLDNLERCIVDVVERGVEGDLIETGVWRGGSTIFMRAVLKALNVPDRVVWVADSFEGLPEPDAERFPAEAKHFRGPILTKRMHRFAASFEDVCRNFEAYGMLDERVRFLKGWFKDTLPAAPIERLAILRLDGDYYESTWDALSALYDRLSIGGYAIIDDYGEDRWTYCAKAVDEFRQQRDIVEPLIKVDSKCSYWRKSRL